MDKSPVESPSQSDRESAEAMLSADTPNGTSAGGIDIPVRSEEDALEIQAQGMRASVYELLASLLVAAPDQGLIDALAGLNDVEGGSSEIEMGWALLKKAAEKSSLEEIEDEYFTLFIGLGRGQLVPHGSWYMTGFLMEKPVAVLRKDLRVLGIIREDGVKKSEDHIAALCNAMALLIRNPDDISFEQQRQFLSLIHI